jgi:hypothetical protein
MDFLYRGDVCTEIGHGAEAWSRKKRKNRAAHMRPLEKIRSENKSISRKIIYRATPATGLHSVTIEVAIPHRRFRDCVPNE